MHLSSLFQRSRTIPAPASAPEASGLLHNLKSIIQRFSRIQGHPQDMKKASLNDRLFKLEEKEHKFNKAFDFVDELMKREGSSATRVIESVNIHEPNIEKVIAILLRKAVQHHDSSWDGLSSRKKIAQAEKHFETLSSFFELNPNEHKQAHDFCFTGLSAKLLDSNRSHFVDDRMITLKDMRENESADIHLLAESSSPHYNCFAESLGIKHTWVSEQINPKGDQFKLSEVDRYYAKQGYKRIQGEINPDLKKSVVLFGEYTASNTLIINHAGRIDGQGFWNSKQGSLGLMISHSPETDVCESYGYPVAQYVKDS